MSKKELFVGYYCVDNCVFESDGGAKWKTDISAICYSENGGKMNITSFGDCRLLVEEIADNYGGIFREMSVSTHYDSHTLSRVRMGPLDTDEYYALMVHVRDYCAKKHS